MHFFRSIRIKLIVTLLAVLIPLAVIQMVTFNRWRGARIALSLQTQVDSAVSLSSFFERYVMSVVHQNDVLALAISSNNPNLNTEQLRLYAQKLKKPHGAMQLYGVTDSKGEIVASSPAEAEGTETGDRDYFKRLKSGEDWAVSNMLMGRFSKKPEFIIANAIRGRNNEFLGIILVSIDVESLESIFPSKLTEGESALVDQVGRLVVDSSRSDISWEERNWSQDELVKAARTRGQASSLEYTSPVTGIRLVGAYVPVPSLGWVAGSFRSYSEVMDPVRDWTRVVVLGSLIALTVAIVIVWLLGSFITHPVLWLTQATKDFAAGKATPPINLKTGDETETLASSFNAMKSRIAEREKQLKELADTNEQLYKSADLRAAEFETVLESIPVGAIIAEGMEGRIVRGNASAERIYGRSIPKGVTIAEYCELFKLSMPDGAPYEKTSIPIGRAMIEGRMVEGEVVMTRSTGDKITVLTNASPIRDLEGNITGAVAAFQDISERKRAEERERTIAEALQDNLLPPLPDKRSGIKIGSKYVAALDEARVGGDFRDVFQLTPTKVAIVIGDVSGKGLSAAMDVAMTKYYIRSYSYITPDEPGLVLSQVNDALLHEESPERFITVFLGIYDRETLTVEYASAGHEPGLLKRASNAAIEELMPTGLALGIFPTEHKCSVLKMERRDVMVLYTDGATEARSPDGVMLEMEGLKKIVSDVDIDDCQSVSDQIYEAIERYAAGKLADDCALLVVSPDD